MFPAEMEVLAQSRASEERRLYRRGPLPITSVVLKSAKTFAYPRSCPPNASALEGFSASLPHRNVLHQPCPFWSLHERQNRAIISNVQLCNQL